MNPHSLIDKRSYFTSIKLFIKPSTCSDGSQEVEIKYICKICGKTMTPDEIGHWCASCSPNGTTMYNSAIYFCADCYDKVLHSDEKTIMEQISQMKDKHNLGDEIIHQDYSGYLMKKYIGNMDDMPVSESPIPLNSDSEDKRIISIEDLNNNQLSVEEVQKHFDTYNDLKVISGYNTETDNRLAFMSGESHIIKNIDLEKYLLNYMSFNKMTVEQLIEELKIFIAAQVNKKIRNK